MTRLAIPLPPPNAPHLVPRAALCARLCETIGARLVLVRAPAGFGKTTALQQGRAELAARGVRTAWLTLDRADNDLPRFIDKLAAALAGLAGTGDAPLADTLALLAGPGTPFALFLDDVELIQEAAVLALLRDLLDRLPDQGQWVIGTRVLPDLGLDRLRAHGRLVEIDAEQLRFSLGDTVDFFRRRGLADLAPAALARLHGKTEGWAAALWLASLALERHGLHSDFIERFSGTDRAIADYLAEDVLAQQSPALREFLLRSSVLHELTLPLCQALWPRADCAALLARLEAGSVFLAPVAGAPGTERRWRYHSLFADFLLAQLQLQHPDEAERLHLVAAGWYEAAGRPVPAIDHALAGGDTPYALALMEQHAEAFLAQGRLRLLARWFDAVPEAALTAHALLQVVAVWASCFTQGPGPALARLEGVDRRPADHAAAQATETAANTTANTTQHVVQAHAAALRPLLLSMMDRFEEAHACGLDHLARLPSCRPFADSVLINTMACVSAAMGLSDQAAQLLDAVRGNAGCNAFVHSYTEAMQALLDLQDGRLRQAGARFGRVLAHDQRRAQPSDHAWAGVLHAQLVYDAHRLDEAEQLLGLYLPMVRDVGLPDHMILSHALSARMAFLRGDVDAALALLSALEYLGHRRQLPRVASSARLERARLWLLQGHGHAAHDELNRADDPALWARVQRQRLPAHETEDLLIGRLRWALHFGDTTVASAALARTEHELTLPAATARPRRQLKLRLLLALALQRSGQHEAALTHLAAVLEATQPEHSLRLVLDEGALATTLLQRWQVQTQKQMQVPATHSAAPSPLLVAHVQRLLDAAGATPLPTLPEAPTAAPPPARPAEALTRQELRILQLLAEGHANGAMGDKLFIADSTVRTHLRAINQKLGARSRAQAVAIARRLALVG